MSKNKYGNLDELLPEDGVAVEDEAPQPRKRRPSPAIGVMHGDSTPTRVTDTLRAEKEKALKELEQARAKFEEEKAVLINKLDEMKSAADSTSPIILTMPVTKQEVSFELQRVDPELIDVSPENERIQDFLDAISLKDILPSFRKYGQQRPGTIRPKKGGRFELIEGSRRLAAAKMTKRPYLALVGEVPDADVRELSVIENKQQDVSPYEKAKAYQRQIQNGEYSNWTQLGVAKEISSSHISRYRACAELDELFVRILPSPSDMPLNYGETIGYLLKKDEPALLQQANALLESRKTALKKGEEGPDLDEILRLLKSSVRTKAPQPTVKQAVTYKSKDGKITLKHSISNKGSTKFELAGVDDRQVQMILEQLKKALKVSH